MRFAPLPASMSSGQRGKQTGPWQFRVADAAGVSSSIIDDTMRKRIILILLILVIIIGAVAYRYRDLLVPGAGANPYIQAALPPGYTPHLRIDVPKMPPGDFKRIVTPASASPFVLLMTELWNLETKSRVATIQYDIGPASPSALSPDGKHFAFEKDGVVNVIEFASGQLVLKIPYDKNTAQLSFVEFAGPSRLAVAARAFSPPDPKKPRSSLGLTRLRLRRRRRRTPSPLPTA